MKYAWAENNILRDVCHGNPAECYTPDIAAHYSTEVSDEAQNGWILVNGQWEAPPQPEPQPAPEPAVTYPKVSPVEFKLLWTSAERTTIKTLRATDPIVDDFYDIIDDPRLTFVDLGLQSTQAAISYLLSKLVAATILTEEQAIARQTDILSGVFK